MGEALLKRDETLDMAKELINGQRAKDYGDAFENHGKMTEEEKMKGGL